MIRRSGSVRGGQPVLTCKQFMRPSHTTQPHPSESSANAFNQPVAVPYRQTIPPDPTTMSLPSCWSRPR